MNGSFLRRGYSAEVSVPIGSALTVTLSGTFVATVTVERRVSGNINDQSVVHTFTAPGTYEDDTPGAYRLQCTSFTSGEVLYSVDSDQQTQSSGGGGGGAVDSVAGKTGAVTLVKGDVGLGNVDNTSDASKPVSTATAAAIEAAVSAASASEGPLVRNSIAVTLAAGQTNNYNPENLSARNILVVTSDAAGSQLSGITAQGEDFTLSIVNKGAGALTLLNESAGSTAANRFALPDDMILPPKTSAELYYDSASARWLLLN